MGPEGSVPPLSDCQFPHLSNTFLTLFYSHFTMAQRGEARQWRPGPQHPAQGSFLYPWPLSSHESGPGHSQGTHCGQLMRRPSFLKMSGTGVPMIVVLGGPQPELPPLSAPISGPAWELTLIALGPHRCVQTVPHRHQAPAVPQRSQGSHTQIPASHTPGGGIWGPAWQWRCSLGCVWARWASRAHSWAGLCLQASGAGKTET